MTDLFITPKYQASGSLQNRMQRLTFPLLQKRLMDPKQFNFKYQNAVRADFPAHLPVSVA